MVLIPTLEQAKVKCLCLQTNQFTLFGFLLYTNCDRVIIDYMSDGICELDCLSGERCLIFVSESPSKQWIEYAKLNGHLWWRKFGQTIAESSSTSPENSTLRNISLLAQNIVKNNPNSTIIIGDDNKTSIRQIITPDTNLPFDRTEALRMAHHFQVRITDIPCLIFFKDLNSSVIWKSTLGHLREQNDVKIFFRSFFDSSDFQSLLAYREEL
ncbi:MAG: hypothetical protein QNJ70_04690 [Xenococcaceae cyanobacterium MO_207.B15]|nr:hypothetical protein [Xenococcaceae cyanobacterium MO_207.B15]